MEGDLKTKIMDHIHKHTTTRLKGHRRSGGRMVRIKAEVMTIIIACKNHLERYKYSLPDSFWKSVAVK